MTPRDSDKRRDLFQEIHFAIWRSFAGYDGRCSLRTWVYRVEGIEGAEIAEVVGLSPGAVGMKVHRIKRLLARQFNERSRT